MVLPGTKCTVGTLMGTRPATYLLISVVVSGCADANLEAHTSAAVPVYSQPNWPHAAGNVELGIIPPNVTLHIRREKLMKDHAAYEIEYKAPDGHILRGYVMLGDHGLEIRRST
jgi:hypothetical protein